MAKICPKCHKEYDDDDFMVCPMDMTPLVKKQEESSAASVNIGDANAISGGVHISDNHSVNNNTVNNTTTNIDSHDVYHTIINERQKTAEELRKESENQFREECKRTLSKENVDKSDSIVLEKLRIKLDIEKSVADNILLQEKELKNKENTIEDIPANIKKEIEGYIYSIQKGEILTIKEQYKSLGIYSDKYNEDLLNFLYYFGLLVGDQKQLISKTKKSIDFNYWRSFFCCIAYIQNNDQQESAKIIVDLFSYKGTYKQYNNVLSSLKELSLKHYESANKIASQFQDSQDSNIVDQLMYSIMQSIQLACRCYTEGVDHTMESIFLYDDVEVIENTPLILLILEYVLLSSDIISSKNNCIAKKKRIQKKAIIYYSHKEKEEKKNLAIKENEANNHARLQEAYSKVQSSSKANKKTLPKWGVNAVEKNIVTLLSKFHIDISEIKCTLGVNEALFEINPKYCINELELSDIKNFLSKKNVDVVANHQGRLYLSVPMKTILYYNKEKEKKINRKKWDNRITTALILFACITHGIAYYFGIDWLLSQNVYIFYLCGFILQAISFGAFYFFIGKASKDEDIDNLPDVGLASMFTICPLVFIWILLSNYEYKMLFMMTIPAFEELWIIYYYIKSKF